MIPVRCFTCGKVIASFYEEFSRRYGEYKQAVTAGEQPKETPQEILDSFGLDRYCCRRMIISHVDLIHDVSPYE
ncbi:MAG: DNA-directed RNA polymerase subunit N [Candidatus Thermoplasmatota archaeon]|nr:DNA-directed RNA polymerase subunit N [Candidatus Thermoplasmatota archaeon]MBU1942020.1 DNA-directed RNA polymerase subunit N [Candidatus Thermoplasmatota archaeon]